MTTLPTANQLERLTLRAIAAYAARSARRGSAPLRGIVEDNIIEAPLRVTEGVASVRELDESVKVSIPLAASCVVKAMAALETPQMRVAALCLTRAARVSLAVLEAVRSEPPVLPGWARTQIGHASHAAAPIPDNAAFALGDPWATTVIHAARSDYEILLQEFGEHTDVVLGEPIDFSDEWWRERRSYYL